MKKTTNYLLIILILALFIRLLFIFHPGFLADIAYWKWWSSASAEKGLVHTINFVNYNYPSFYLYILKATGHIYSLFASANAPDFYNTYNPLFLFLIKLPYIFADLGIGILIFLITKNVIARNEGTHRLVHPEVTKQSRPGLPRSFQSLAMTNSVILASALYLFNPVTIYNSAIWGQTDSLGTFFALLAIYFVVGAGSPRPFLSAIIMSLAFFLKIQTNILILFTFIYIFIRFGLSNTIKAVGIATISSLILNAPYLISHTFDKVINTILTSFNYFPYISLNAYNLQWFLAPIGRPDQILDTTILIGSLSYKTFGLILFAITILISVSYLRTLRNLSNLDSALISSSALAVFAFFMFLTQMHERYIFPLFALLPIIVVVSYLRNLSYLSNLITFAVLSITSLLNLHLVMLLNYSQTTNLPLLPQTYDPALAHNLSFINVIIFILFLLPFLRQLPKKLLLIPPVIIVVLISSSYFKFQISNFKFIYLTDLTPAKAVQGFGVLTKNKNLSGQRLSSSYVYYEKGLATHANSEIIYNLEKKYKTFTTDFGIDTGANEGATVEFKILVDDKEVLKSGKMGKWDGPKSVKLDVSNAQKLTLIVTDAGDGLTNDHSDWLNPKLFSPK